MRDVFDLAAVIDRDGEKQTSSLPEIEDRSDKGIDRIDTLASSYERLAVDDIHPTGTGKKYLDAPAVQSVLAFLRAWDNANRLSR